VGHFLYFVRYGGKLIPNKFQVVHNTSI